MASTALNIQNIEKYVTIKLTRQNYILWKSLFLSILQNHDLEGFIDGSRVCPPQHRMNQQGRPSQTVNPDYIEWKRQDQELRMWFHATISDDLLPYVVEATSAAELWKSLEEEFSSSSDDSYLHQLKDQLECLKKGNRSITEYLQDLKNISDSLASAGSPIPPSELIYKTLNGLPPEYDSFATQIRMRDPPISLDKLRSLLISEDNARIQALTAPNQALMASSTVRPSSYAAPIRTKYNPTLFCEFCNRRGHSTHDCFSKGKNKNNQKYTSFNSYNSKHSISVPKKFQPHVAQTPFSTHSSPPFHAQTSSPTQWYADTGATHHVTSNLANLSINSPYIRQNQLHVGNGQGLNISNTEYVPRDTASITLKILSYNVWFREDLEVDKRMKAIGDLIEQHSPDFICFQEVTVNIYHLFQQSRWWKVYQCSVSPEIAATRPYFCMQLSKIPVKSFNCRPFRNSVMGRELCVAKIEVEEGKPLVVATSHLESPTPAPPKWDQMHSKERVAQAKEAVIFLKDLPNVIFAGDMNWDDELDGQFPLPDGWIDAWSEVRPRDIGYTYDTRSNKMLTGNRTLQKRLDRFICNFQDFEICGIEMIGLEAIPGLSYCKHKKVRNEVKLLTLPVLPSDHYGLLLTICKKP